MLQQQPKWTLLGAFCTDSAILKHCLIELCRHQGKLSENLRSAQAQCTDMLGLGMTPTKQLPEDLHQRLLGGRYPLRDLPSLVPAKRSSDFFLSRLRQRAVLEHSVLSKYGPVQGSWGTSSALKGVEDVCIASKHSLLCSLMLAILYPALALTRSRESRKACVGTATA